MTPPRPLVIVTLPARTVEEALVQLHASKSAGADAAEIRADRWSDPERAAVGRLFPAPVPLVATYRSRAEGGEGHDAPDARQTVLLDLARHPFRWIDLELARDRAVLARLPPADRLGRIVSCHLSSPRGDDWKRRLTDLEEIDGIGKLVVGSGVGDALHEILPEAMRVGEEVVVLTTGPSGPLLRAWARRLGYPLVFAAPPSGAGEAPVEPSQISVDLLRPFLEAEETPPIFAVCGNPVRHSRSPELHGRWMRADGELGLYLALEPASDREFLDALGPMADGGFRGLNVTQPFKAAAAQAATELGAGVRACGVANCLSFRDGGVAAENTDLLAMLRRLEELRARRRWEGALLAVVGAGGAARATLAAARTLGARATVYARRPAVAEELADSFGADVGASAVPFPLVVHATNVGRDDGAALDVPLAGLLAPGGLLLDWVYRPRVPVLRNAAEAAGATYEDGWRLFVYQAAASYEIWWGHPPGAAALAESLQEGGGCAA